MKTYLKRSLPLAKVRRVLEPGPVVLVSSAWKGGRDVMTLGWHVVLAFEPSLIGCVIDTGNHSFGLIRKSRECVINVPTADMADTVVGIGNCSGAEVDKFAKFGLATAPGRKVAAPLLADCFANLECRLVDTRLVRAYDFFVFEVVRAVAAVRPRYPRTLHYHGEGIFTPSGPAIDKSRRFTKFRGTPNF